MSVEAITWALAQEIRPSSAKFVLVAMANCANSDNTCFPSMQYLSEATCQDRKTVLENIKRLRDAGFLTDTGLRSGRTHQVVVYQLKSPESGTGTESGTVPKTEAKGPVFPRKQSQKRTETVPKSGHGTVINRKEPSRKQKTVRECAHEVSADDLVADGLTEQTAEDFLRHRERKKTPLTFRAWRDHKREAAKAGWSVEAAADKVIAKDWRGFEASYVQGERGPPTGETTYQRSMRQRVAEFAPAAAAKAPSDQRKPVAEIIDVTARLLG